MLKFGPWSHIAQAAGVSENRLALQPSLEWPALHDVRACAHRNSGIDGSHSPECYRCQYRFVLRPSSMNLPSGPPLHVILMCFELILELFCCCC